jgi:hypothetical protein
VYPGLRPVLHARPLRRPGWLSRNLLGLLVLAAFSGCGFGGESGKNCRCVPETAAAAFPHCRGISFDTEPEASNPFATRQPECPSGQLLFLREPTTPEAVLFNVRDTFQGFSPVQYMDLLSEDYLFVPDLGGLELYPEVYQPPGDYDPVSDRDTLWTREDERRFATNFLDRTEFQRITVDRWYQAGEDDVIFDESEPLIETYIFDYAIDLTLPPNDEGVSLLIQVRGRAEVDLTTPTVENPVWIVRRWQDLRDPASTKRSMTELRGEFSQ